MAFAVTMPPGRSAPATRGSLSAGRLRLRRLGRRLCAGDLPAGAAGARALKRYVGNASSRKPTACSGGWGSRSPFTGPRKSQFGARRPSRRQLHQHPVCKTMPSGRRLSAGRASRPTRRLAQHDAIHRHHHGGAEVISMARAAPSCTNLTLSIRPGEKVGRVGSSGAGKSTLVRLCAAVAAAVGRVPERRQAHAADCTRRKPPQKLAT